MLLKDKFWPGRNPRTISDAFLYDTLDTEGGLAERAGNNAEKAIERLGALLELLHRKGLLSDRDVLEFFGTYRWEAAE